MGKCYNSVSIAASSDEVWATIKDFHNMSWAPDVVANLTAVGDFCNPIYQALLAALKNHF